MNIGDRVRAIINYSVVEGDVVVIKKGVGGIMYDIEAGHHIYTDLYEFEVQKEKEKLKEGIEKKIKELQGFLDSIGKNG